MALIGKADNNSARQRKTSPSVKSEPTWDFGDAKKNSHGDFREHGTQNELEGTACKPKVSMTSIGKADSNNARKRKASPFVKSEPAWDFGDARDARKNSHGDCREDGAQNELERRPDNNDARKRKASPFVKLEPTWDFGDARDAETSSFIKSEPTWDFGNSRDAKASSFIKSDPTWDFGDARDVKKNSDGDSSEDGTENELEGMPDNNNSRKQKTSPFIKIEPTWDFRDARDAEKISHGDSLDDGTQNELEGRADNNSRRNSSPFIKIEPTWDVGDARDARKTFHGDSSDDGTPNELEGRHVRSATEGWIDKRSRSKPNDRLSALFAYDKSESSRSLEEPVSDCENGVLESTGAVPAKPSTRETKRLKIDDPANKNPIIPPPIWDLDVAKRVDHECPQSMADKDVSSSPHTTKTSSPTEPSSGSSNPPARRKGKEFPCSYCPKVFNKSSSRTTHELVHTGEKPHMCTFPTCLKRFSVRSNLRRHLKIHRSPPKDRGLHANSNDNNGNSNNNNITNSHIISGNNINNINRNYIQGPTTTSPYPSPYLSPYPSPSPYPYPHGPTTTSPYHYGPTTTSIYHYGPTTTSPDHYGPRTAGSHPYERLRVREYYF